MMSATIFIAQVTGVLVFVLLTAAVLRRNPTKAHSFLIAGLAVVLCLPLLTLITSGLGWGMWPPIQSKSPVASVLFEDSQGTSQQTPVVESTGAADQKVRTNDTIPPMQPLPDAEANLFSSNINRPGTHEFDHQLPGGGRPTIQFTTPPITGDSHAQIVERPFESSHVQTIWLSTLRQINWRAAIGIGWGLLSLLAVVRLVRGSVSAWRIVGSSQTLSHREILNALELAKSDLKLKHNLRITESNEIACPVMWSWFRPTVVIPTASVESDVEWRSVLTHELAHYKRADHWWATMGEVIRCIFPWHPLVIISCRWLNQLSDRACDQWAVRFGDNCTEYAESLLCFAPVKPLPLLSSMAVCRTHLQRRIRLVLDSKTTQQRAGVAFTSTVFALAFASALGLSLSRAYRVEPLPQTRPTEPTSSIPSQKNSAAESTDDRTDEQWQASLIAIPDSASWYVGKNYGYQLSALPGDRGYEILKACWSEIAVSVRMQILKGFTPGFSQPEILNDRYFDVIDLGMQSNHKDLKLFAVSYLNGMTFRQFEDGPDDYSQWRESISGKDANDIVKAEIKRFIDLQSNPDTRNVPVALEFLTNNYFGHLPDMRIEMNKLGLKQLMDGWVQDGFVAENHPAFEMLKPLPANTVPEAGFDPESLTDEQWIARLTSAPEESRWHIGANFGNNLSNMSGDRGYQILLRCWDQIATSVRTQILKGFSPGFGTGSLNEKYFDVLNMGMQSKEKQIQEFATTYLNQITIRTFAGPGEDYSRWWEENKERNNHEIVEQECRRFVGELAASDSEFLTAYLQRLGKSAFKYCPLQKSALEKAGISKQLEELISSDKLDLVDAQTFKILGSFSVSSQIVFDAFDRKMNSLVESWENMMVDDGDESGKLSAFVSAIGEPAHPRSIPTMIGLIDADNSYATVYWIGYFILRRPTGVKYSPLHDGAWWKRWWEKNKKKFGDEVASIPVPELTKTKHGKNHTPFPESLETLQGKLDWMVAQFKAGKPFDKAVHPVVEEHNDPRAIPTLIGMIDADNSYDTVYGIGYFGLGRLTGVEYNPMHDGAWWRRWWEKNKSKYPSEVSELTIPDYPKTEHGKTHVPFAEALDTLDGKIEALKNSTAGDEYYQLILDSLRHTKFTAADIPKLIGILDADNSRRASSQIGLQGDLTGVGFSPHHDGAWWRRWWEKNKSKFPLEVQRIPIPDLPKTEHGKTYVPFPEGLDSIDGKIEYLNSLKPFDEDKYRVIIDSMMSMMLPGQTPADTSIPKMIGIIEADNSYRTVYGVGYFGMRGITDVGYNPLHDGAWWRRWWERNKQKYSVDAQNTPIPVLPKTPHGEKYQSLPAKLDTLDGKIEWMIEGMPSSIRISLDDLAESFAEHDDTRAIPYLIGWLAKLDDERQRREIQNGGLAELVGIKPAKGLEGRWWIDWWAKNRANYPNALQEIPDLTKAVAIWKAIQAARAKQDVEAEFDGIPSVQRHAADNEKMKYFQIGPPQNADAPAGGWKVLLILPGGAGDEAFNPFCRRIHKHALPKDYIAVELVAPKWSDDEERVVWPTNRLNSQQADFTTEEFIAKTVEDVKKHVEINEKFVFALGWSSGGPAVYANSMSDNSPVTGSFVAMSVFNESWLPDLKKSRGHKYFILHSPTDFIKIQQAQNAVEKLDSAGAQTRLKTYNGGHGWTEDPYGNINTGIKWLEENN